MKIKCESKFDCLKLIKNLHKEVEGCELYQIDKDIILFNLFKRQEKTIINQYSFRLTHKDLQYISEKQVGYITFEITGKYNQKSKELDLSVGYPFLTIYNKLSGEEEETLSIVELLGGKIKMDYKEKEYLITRINQYTILINQLLISLN